MSQMPDARCRMPGAGRPVRRLEDWPRLLGGFLAARAAAPFAWGENDCCLFAADAILAMTGVDVARCWRGYKTARGAAGRISRAGGSLTLLAGALAAPHGWPRIDPRLAGRGDIVTVETPRGPGLGVIGLDGRHALCPGPRGLVPHALPGAGPAWRIG